MSEGSNAAGCLVPVAWVVSIIGSGLLAYNWVNPHNFVATMGFMILWSIMAAVFQFLITVVFAAIFGDD